MNESSQRMYSKEDDHGITTTTEQSLLKIDDKQKQKENGSTKSTLMSMPNELFDFLLIYLSPCDIVQSLYGINERLNALISRFTHTIDVSSKRKPWLKKYLSSIQSLATAINFNHSQLRTLFPSPSTIDDQYPCLESIKWNYNFGYDNQQCLSYLNVFKRKLSSLTLNVNADDEETVHNNVALTLLQNDSLIEQLIMRTDSYYSPMWFSFRPNTLKSNQHLKQLTIKLHYVHDLFILVENLSVLEYLNVEVCEIEKKDHYDYGSIEKKTATLSPLLKQLTMQSMDFSYSRLLLFLRQFQQSMEFLSLNMSIHESINGEILESTIITKLPKLKEFKFLFQISVDENVDIDHGKKQEQLNSFVLTRKAERTLYTLYTSLCHPWNFSYWLADPNSEFRLFRVGFLGMYALRGITPFLSWFLFSKSILSALPVQQRPFILGLDKLISTFHSTSYWSTHPMMCYHERCCPCFTILSLPWILKESDPISNEIMNHRTNISIPLQMPDVKSIFLASARITVKFLKFIKETFIQLNKMIISWHTCTIDDIVINRKKKVKLTTIKTLKYYGGTSDLEYIDFLLLTPNIRRLITDGSTVHIMNGYVHENDQLALICGQLLHLNIFRNYSDCDEDETEETFPNALVSSKDIGGI